MPTLQGDNRYNWVVFTLNPWAIQIGSQFFQMKCYIPSIPRFSENCQTIFAPLYYSITEFLALPILITKNLSKDLKMIVPASLMNTPLGNYITQRGLDSYSIKSDSQRWLFDLQQPNNCFLWYPHDVFINKEQGLSYQLGLSPIKELLKKISNEYSSLYETTVLSNNNATSLSGERKFYFLKSHFYPSNFDFNPLETICDISYEELAHGTLKNLDIQNALIDDRHLLELILFEYPIEEISTNDFFDWETKSQELFNKFQELSSPDFESLLFKLIQELFPLKYSLKSFRNRFLSLLQIVIKKQNSPIVEHLQTIYNKIATGETFPAWDKFLDYLQSKGLCQKQNNHIQITWKDSLWKKVKSSFISYQSTYTDTSEPETSEIRKLKWTPGIILSHKMSKKFYIEDVNIFEEDYTRAFHIEWSKEAEVCRPFFWHVPGSRIGIVLSHGYLSAPMEIRALAEYLFRQGFSVYGVRLKGHGTSPLDLASTSWEEWYEALNRGVACIRSRCEKVFLCGFSAGGCLILSASANKEGQIEGIVSISAPLKLQNYAINLVPTITTLNIVLKRFGGSGWEMIDHRPENPQINYQKNPIKALQQLRLLMERTEELLPRVIVPTLIIQGSHDTTVNPDSANIIFQMISSEQKRLIFFNRSRHGIINGPGSEEIFATVSNFISEIAKGKVS